MIGKKILSLGLVLAMTATLAACGEKADPDTGSTLPETTAEAAEVTQTSTGMEEIAPALPTANFEDLEALIGLEDAEAADRFGVSAENWTEDRSTFIGRIYQLSLFGEQVKVFTSYSDEQKVVSVSAWVTDGTEKVTEEDVQIWVERIGAYTLSEPIFDNTTSEGGSRVWKWKKDDVFITLFWLGDQITIEILPAVGELK